MAIRLLVALLLCFALASPAAARAKPDYLFIGPEVTLVDALHYAGLVLDGPVRSCVSGETRIRANLDIVHVSNPKTLVRLIAQAYGINVAWRSGAAVFYDRRPPARFPVHRHPAAGVWSRPYLMNGRFSFADAVMIVSAMTDLPQTVRALPRSEAEGDIEVKNGPLVRVLDGISLAHHREWSWNGTSIVWTAQTYCR